MSEISHSGERVQHTMNEERTKTKILVFAKPNDPTKPMIINMEDMDMIIRLIINMIEMDMIMLIINMKMDMIILTINVVEMNVIIGLMISMVDVQVNKQIVKDMRSADASVAMKDTIFMVMIATYIVNTSGEIIRTTLTRSSQNTTNSLEGVVLMFIMLV